jgi:hypothetical protein
MPYELRGRFLEACDCSVPCPCWFEQDPDDDECTGLIAWQIEQGTINGFDVSGRTVVSLSQHGGHRAHPDHMNVSLVVDDEADEGQFIALKEAFAGELGGPLAELARMSPDPDGVVERAPVTFATDGHELRLRVGPRVDIQARLLTGARDRPITIGDGALSNLLGDPGEAGKASRFHLELPGRDPIEATARSTTSGRFRYRHEG